MRVINRERYIRNGVKTASTNKEYITALKRGGYATEDDYIEHIMRIIEKFRKQGLFQQSFQVSLQNQIYQQIAPAWDTNYIIRRVISWVYSMYILTP